MEIRWRSPARLNIRNMNPMLVVTGRRRRPLRRLGHRSERRDGRDRLGLLDRSASSTKYVDYVGNGVYTVILTTYTRELRAPTGADASPSRSPPPPPSPRPPPRADAAAELVGVQHGQAADRPQPRRAGDRCLRGLNVAPNPDGSLPGTPTQLFPDATTRTVDVRLDKGPGTYVVAARAKGFTGSTNPQAFSPWATPVGHPRVRPVRPQVVHVDRLAAGRATASTRRSWRRARRGG